MGTVLGVPEPSPIVPKNMCDAFIYPVFWTEAPAKLVGWFDRVWSYGLAYGEKTMNMLKAYEIGKGLFS